MKYLLFLFLVMFFNLNQKKVNYKCKIDTNLYFFNNVSEKYMYLDKYKYKVEKIGIFNCKKRNCKLKKVINKKEFYSNKDFFKNCG